MLDLIKITEFSIPPAHLSVSQCIKKTRKPYTARCVAFIVLCVSMSDTKISL